MKNEKTAVVYVTDAFHKSHHYGLLQRTLDSQGITAATTVVHALGHQKDVNLSSLSKKGINGADFKIAADVAGGGQSCIHVHHKTDPNNGAGLTGHDAATRVEKIFKLEPKVLAL